MRADILPIEMCFAQAEFLQMISSVWSKRPAAPYRRRAQTFSLNIWEPVSVLRNAK